MVSNIKYNFFKQYYVLRFQTQIPFQNDQIVQFLITKYQPTVQTINISQSYIEENNYISIQPPNFQNYISQNQILQNLSINDLLIYTSSKFAAPLIDSNINQTIYYDYKTPSNFIHFGSYQSRLNAFVNKYKSVQNVLNTTENGDISSIVQGFNSFQRGCFYNQNLIVTGSNKQIVSIQSTTSSAFLKWYQQIYSSSIQYDKINIHSLLNFIPQSIYQDERNKDLLTLVNLIGDTYDQYWSVIKSIKQFSGVLQDQLQQYGESFLKDLLRNFGFQYQNSFPTTQLPVNFIQTGQMSSQKYNKVLLSRLISNMPLLLKAKGTRQALEQILNIYGYSQNIIRINQYKKYGYTGSNIINQSKPYYNTSYGLQMNINQQYNTAVIYFRVPQQKDVIISDKVTYINFQPQHSYMSFLRVSSSSLLVKHYKDGVLFNTATKSNADIKTLIFEPNVYVDSIKIINNYTNSIQNIYSLGKNTIDRRDNIVALYDFNSFTPNKVTSSNVTLYYTNSGIKVSNFNTVQYSSLFSIANTPSKYYQIQQNIQNVTLSIQGTIRQQQNLNRSNIFVGSLYSDRINSEFVVDYSQKFQNLLDNQRRKYKYTKLNQYKNFYFENYLNTQTVSYTSMSKFYQDLDNTVFKTIKAFTPQSVQVKYGLLLDNDILTRNRIPQIQFATSSHLNWHVKSKQNINSSVLIRQSNLNIIKSNTKVIDVPLNGTINNSYKSVIEVPKTIINSINKTKYIKTNIRNNTFNIKCIQAIYRLKNIKVTENIIHSPKYKYTVTKTTDVKVIENKAIQKKMIIDQKQQLSITNIKI